jgi:hypothetical protein
MSPPDASLTPFERSARALLEESVSRIDGRTRSRLNQARHAAVEAVGARRRSLWRGLTLMPAAGVVAALLIGVVLWQREPAGELPVLEGQHSAMEDMDLLADAEALELLDGWDGPFYEWAESQNEANGASDS